eukprot:CAMPEP_0118661536 /NCGR_PEP_ID=MMETSP0785-20121206/16332_1 /TAXON_ID=91992 /ORGANISM="Bolidomonas pacifica, Strain CCMP 1866" /LENGTH=1313 /DNA_ID=CAMNT_0006554983 /DNA_START=25 /DNA_END=3962 /DNA_ORIENTATION=-
MRTKTVDLPPGAAFAKMTVPKDYLYRQNSAVVHSPDNLSPNGAAREKRYNMRKSERDELMRQKKLEEDIANKNRLVLKKKEMAEERFNYRNQSNDNRLSTLFNDPMQVVASLRDRCRQKPHLLTNMFPPKDTTSMGLLTAEDLHRGLKTMGFDLPPKKFQLVLTVLGLSRSLADGRCIPISQLKNAVLEKRLESHQEESHWKERGGTLAARYKQRAASNLGDPAVDKLNELDEMEALTIQRERQRQMREKEKIVVNLSETAREMLKKLGERFSTVRRAFRTMDKDRSGSLTRIELKNILDTFCMEVSHEDFDKLMDYFDADHDGLVSYEEFLAIVRNEIQPQISAGASRDDPNSSNVKTPQRPSEFDPKSRRRPKRNYQTEYAASYVRPGYLPLKSLDELKIYHDFLKKISTEFENVYEAFMAIDIHREGFITRDELKDVLDNFAFKMSSTQFEALVNVFDTDHDGRISYEEFLQQVKYCDDISAQEEEDARMKEMLEFDKSPAAQRRLQKMKNRTRKVTSYEFLMEKIWEKSSSIHEAFKMMDKDRSGSLSAGELKALLDSYCYKVPDEIFANMLSLFDADGDGEISYHEFMAQVKRSVAGDSGYTPDMGSVESGGGGGLSDLATSGGEAQKSKMKGNAAERRRIAKKQKTLKTLLQKIGDKFSTVRRAFMTMDKDKSGTLDYDELRTVLESTGYKIEDEVFDDILEVFDSNCDGEIDYQEFLAQLKDYIQAKEEGGIGSQLAEKAGRNLGRQGALNNRDLSAVEKAHQAKTVGAALRFLCEKIHEKWGDIKKSFQMLDWDKSGTITASELRAVLDDCCYTTTDEVFNQVIAIFDQDGDGNISYNELLGTLKKVVNGEVEAVNPADVGKKEQFSQMVEAAELSPEMDGGISDRLNRRRSSFQRDSYGPPPDLIGGPSQLPARFQTKITNIPNLGHGHLHICKAINQRISVISDALKRLDYDRKFFISSEELKASIETYCGRLNPVLWDDILHFFDPSMTGLVDYLKFLDEVRAQATADMFEDDDDEKNAKGVEGVGSMKQGFKAGKKAGMMNSSAYNTHHGMQDGGFVTNKGSAMGTGSHGSNSVAASMKFLCEKIYEKFPTIRNAFMSLDVDRGGTIGKKELKNILDDCCYTVPDDTFEAIYALFDTDGDGDISYKEFMDQVKNIVEPSDNEETGLSNILINRDHKHAQRPGTLGVSQFKSAAGGMEHSGEEGLKFLQTKLREQTESVRRAFRLLDNDGSGSVGYEEMRKVLDNYCYKMNDEEFRKLMEILDIDQDGKVSYEEFMIKIGSEISFQAPGRQRKQSQRIQQSA